MTRLILAILLTTFLSASAYGKDWTPVGATVQPKSKTDVALRFDIEDIRGNGKGCVFLGCQIVLPESWKLHRREVAPRWYSQCDNRIREAHDATHDWNPRDVKEVEDKKLWLVAPKILRDEETGKPIIDQGSGKPKREAIGARYICFKETKKRRPKPRLPAVSMAPAQGDVVETYDTRVGRADEPPPKPRAKPKPPPTARIVDRRPPPVESPSPKATTSPPESETATPAPMKPNELDASRKTFRIVAAAGFTGRNDRGYDEFQPNGYARGGAELLLGELFLTTVAVDTVFNGSETLLGVRGSLGFVFWRMEAGFYGRYLRGVMTPEDTTTATLRDLGPYLALVAAENHVVGFSIVLDVSIGSRVLRDESDLVFESSTLAPAFQAFNLGILLRFAP